MTLKPTQRAKALAKIVAGLSIGTPLTVICSEPGMPCDDTVRSWADDDDAISRAIAHARARGFDQIALDALTIADTQEIGEIVTEKPDGTIERKTEDMLGHRRLRVDTRLKLLAKWDPKRYGDRTELTGAGGGPVVFSMSEADSKL